MQYGKFGTVEKEISLLGLGVMRLPMDEEGKVDAQHGIDLIRHAVDHGINYIDTGYTYHGGESERIIGKALKDGYREKVLIADKLPMWMIKTKEDVVKIFNDQFDRLGVDHIDMYLVHNVVPDAWETVKKLDILSFLDEMKAQGRIGHIGFSFHGEYDLFTEVIDAYPWEYCQIQLNYLDKDEQATLKGLEYARARGIDVIVMEPLKGGRITDKIPQKVQEIWDRAKAEGIAPDDRTPAEWAFRWVANQPGVSLILSGMGSFAQLDENIAIFSQDDFRTMTEQEYEIIEEVAAYYNSTVKYQCTSCRYCLPCPAEIEIPEVIGFVNNWISFDHVPSTKTEYIFDFDAHGSDCIKCGHCADNCPQRLPVMDIMEEAVKCFGK